MSNFMAASNQNQNPNKSFEVTHPPNDSISSLSFSPKSNILVATSWDNQVSGMPVFRCDAGRYTRVDRIASVPKASISHDQPIVCLYLVNSNLELFTVPLAELGEFTSGLGPLI
ncbi:hypothetical protein ACFX19_020285 [Malus domestica]